MAFRRRRAHPTRLASAYEEGRAQSNDVVAVTVGVDRGAPWCVDARHALTNDREGIGRAYVLRRAEADEPTLARVIGFYTLRMALAVQGGEADDVVLLMTRSRGAVNFLLDRHRINVALSRARDAVIILGHRGGLARNDEGPIADLIRHGLAADTRDLVQPDARTDLQRELASRVVR